jgi:hypothetical protein
MKFLEGVFVIDIAAYLVARDLVVVVANPVAVAIVQAEIESVTSIAAVELVAVTAVLEMVTNLMHLVVIVAELEPSIVVAHAQSVGLSAFLNYQIEVQGPAATVTQGHYFPTVDVYLIGCFADLLVAAFANLKDYSVVQVTSVIAAHHQHYSVAQASGYVACWLYLSVAPEAVAVAAVVEAKLTVESLASVADE